MIKGSSNMKVNWINKNRINSTMKYKIYKLWYNGGKQFIEDSTSGEYIDKRIKHLNKQIPNEAVRPLKYILETEL